MTSEIRGQVTGLLPGLRAFAIPMRTRFRGITVREGALNTVTDGAAGMQQFAGDATLLFYMSEEAQEGRDAFKEKRRPDFARFPRRP